MFEWDQDKNDANLIKHGLSFDDAEQVFDGPTLTFEDTRFDYAEVRLITFGLLKGRMVVVAHTKRGANSRIISMRKGNRREQQAYQKRLRAGRYHQG